MCFWGYLGREWHGNSWTRWEKGCPQCGRGNPINCVGGCEVGKKEQKTLNSASGSQYSHSTQGSPAISPIWELHYWLLWAVSLGLSHAALLLQLAGGTPWDISASINMQANASIIFSHQFFSIFILLVLTCSRESWVRHHLHCMPLSNGPSAPSYTAMGALTV